MPALRQVTRRGDKRAIYPLGSAKYSKATIQIGISEHVLRKATNHESTELRLLCIRCVRYQYIHEVCTVTLLLSNTERDGASLRIWK